MIIHGIVRPPSASRQAPAVYALVPAYGRPAILARALASLPGHSASLRGVILVNNSADASIAGVVAGSGVPAVVVTPSCNLGTAGGIAAGLQVFLRIPDATHVWILDDDAVAFPGALDAMLAAMASAEADAAMPLLAGEDGSVRWVPCRLPVGGRAFLRSGPTAVQIRQHYGAEPRPCAWGIWASVVVSRRAVLAAGLPRVELWSQFSDIEYLLRVTDAYRAVLVPNAVCAHLPPESAGEGFDWKIYAALQNAGYVTTRIRHGRRALRHLPGQHVRYLRHYHGSPRAWLRMASAFLQGAILGRPAPISGDLAQIRAEVAQAAETDVGVAEGGV